MWLKLLDTEETQLYKESYICTHQFHSCDIDTNGIVSFNSKTKYTSNNGNNSLNCPPRPAAALKDIETHDLLNGQSIDSKRKRKSSKLAEDPPPKAKTKTDCYKPNLHQHYMGNAQQLLTTFRAIIDHVVCETC